MIDLHLHTTASDGRCTPEELVQQAAAAGIAVLAVTDHDTTAAVDEVARHARALGLEAVPGIEVTAVESGRDIHVLGYFVDQAIPVFQRFLVSQREIRRGRVDAIARRLAELGRPIELAALPGAEAPGGASSLGRPQVARAMMAAGYVASVQEAFDQWLGPGGPAFVPREGPSPETVIDMIHAAGGLASLAHPGRTGIDERIAPLRAHGLDAIEVFHSDHSAADIRRYGDLASAHGLLSTGGSDFHGDPSRPVQPGTATLPQAEWERLSAARGRRA